MEDDPTARFLREQAEGTRTELRAVREELTSEKPLAKQLAEAVADRKKLAAKALRTKALEEEMHGFEEHQVYHPVLRRVAEADPNGKFIRVCWV